MREETAPPLATLIFGVGGYKYSDRVHGEIHGVSAEPFILQHNPEQGKIFTQSWKNSQAVCFCREYLLLPNICPLIANTRNNQQLDIGEHISDDAHSSVSADNTPDCPVHCCE